MLFYVSNLCHFVVLPFAFLYTESEGFGEISLASSSSSSRRFVSRVRETSVTLMLVLALLVLLVQVLKLLHVPALHLLMMQQLLSLAYISTAVLGACVSHVVLTVAFRYYQLLPVAISCYPLLAVASR
jgi:hypothetical protein